MSYNIDSVEYLSGRLEIQRGVAQSLASQYESDLAEDNLFDYLDLGGPLDGDPEEWLVIKDPTWSGEGSGRREHVFHAILAKTRGKAELLLTWEGGDSLSGLSVLNGVVTERKAKVTLED
jgi:hypothetical protein